MKLMTCFPALYYFLPFRPPTPPVSLPKFPRPDLGLGVGPPAGGLCVLLPALEGRNECFGTSGKAFSLLLSFVVLIAGAPSSAWLCNLCILLAFSCTFLNFSNSSAHFIAPSSLAFNRLGLSKPVLGVGGMLPKQASAFFCRT